MPHYNFILKPACSGTPYNHHVSRSKTRRACDSCRSRKIKCIAHGELCFNCTKKNLKCTFNDTLPVKQPNRIQWSPNTKSPSSLKSLSPIISTETSRASSEKMPAPAYLEPLRCLLQYRVLTWHLTSDLVEKCLDFFTQFGIEHSLVSLEKFTQLLLLPHRSPVVDIIMSTMASLIDPQRQSIYHQTALDQLNSITNVEQQCLATAINTLRHHSVIPLQYTKDPSPSLPPLINPPSNPSMLTLPSYSELVASHYRP